MSCPVMRNAESHEDELGLVLTDFTALLPDCASATNALDNCRVKG